MNAMSALGEIQCCGRCGWLSEVDEAQLDRSMIDVALKGAGLMKLSSRRHTSAKMGLLMGAEARIFNM